MRAIVSAFRYNVKHQSNIIPRRKRNGPTQYYTESRGNSTTFRKNSGDAFRTLLQESLNSVLKAESAEQLQAAPYERNDDRTDSRNGFRDRDLVTRIGTITLHVPRHRTKPFKTHVFENYSRSEAALIASMSEMVVNGVSTRKVSRVVEALCGESCSKSAVSELCKELDEGVKAFRERPLTGRYPFLTVDATYFKVRENGRVIPRPLQWPTERTKQDTGKSLGSASTRMKAEKPGRIFCLACKNVVLPA